MSDMKRDFEAEWLDFTVRNGDGQTPCDDASRAIVAWFDGEATPEEERRARRHLEECLRCTAMWRDWNNARFLWRSNLTTSAPIGLLTRILQVIRLQSVSSPRRHAPQSTALRTQEPALSANATRPDAEIEEAPPELLSAILERTTRCAILETAPMPMVASVALSNHRSVLREMPSFSLGSRMAMVAVPVVFCFAVVTQSLVEQSASPIAPTVAFAPPLQSILDDAPKNAPISAPKRVAAIALPNRKIIVAKTATATLAAPPVSAAQPLATADTSRVDRVLGATPRIQNGNAATLVAAKPTLRFASLSSAPRPPAALPHRASVSPAAIPTRAKTVSLRGVTSNRTRLATISHWSSRAVERDGSPIGAVRIAASLDGDEHFAAPRRALASDIERAESDSSITMRSALEEVQSSGDNRPRAVSSVVDAYAAALLAENSDDNAGIDG